LEVLEDRTLLNNRFVVPLDIVPNNVTTFSNIGLALTTPGLAAGDVIQIERGATPGTIVSADVAGVPPNLTIQGDPAYGAVEIPAFVIGEALTISQPNITLKNVSMILGGGNVTIAAPGAQIVNSIVVNTFNLPTNSGAIQLQSSGATITGSTISSSGGVPGSDVIKVTPVANANNRITVNTIVSTGPNDQRLLEYANGAVTTQDQILGNNFLGNNGANSPLLLIGGSVNTMTIGNNIFRSNNSNQHAVDILPDVQNFLFTGNTISLAAPGNIGLTVAGGATGTTTTVRVTGNHINTGGAGTGLELTPGSSGSIFQVTVDGNDFHYNMIGIHVVQGAGGTASGIDLGGGVLGSQGANDFRSFPAGPGGTNNDSPTHGAIVVAAPVGQGTINALHNIYDASVTNPEEVVYDNNDDPTLIDVNELNPLSGNDAYVQRLYAVYANRVADPSGAAAAVAYLNAHPGSAATVANNIARSAEGLGFFVDTLYRRFLNRDADPAGLAAAVSFLQRGGTLENLVVNLVTSAEYQTVYDTDTAFVQSLAGKLLNRVGSSSDVAAWVAAVGRFGRAALARSFLTSAEYRTLIVTQMYISLLHRQSSPSAAEVAGWVNSGLDILRIRIAFTASAEFQANG
jgi:hypothetical protein